MVYRNNSGRLGAGFIIVFLETRWPLTTQVYCTFHGTFPRRATSPTLHAESTDMQLPATCHAMSTHCNTLQDTATHCKTHCNTLQHTATHCNTLHAESTDKQLPATCHVMSTHCNTMQHTATHCHMQQHTATHCNTLQHTATHCNTLTHYTPSRAMRYRVLHCVTLCCRAAVCVSVCVFTLVGVRVDYRSS